MGNNLSRNFLNPENRRSIKCYLAVNRHLQQALLDVVHDPQYGGIPRDPEELHKFFIANKKIIDKLQKKNILKQDQINLLFQPNQRTFSDKWDITLICVIILNFTKLPKHINDSVTKARSLRNIFNHATWKDFFQEKEFKAFFNDTKTVIAGLNYKNIAEFNDLDNDLIDQKHFKDDIDLFMCKITTKEKENVIFEVLDWLKKENEKGI